MDCRSNGSQTSANFGGISFRNPRALWRGIDFNDQSENFMKDSCCARGRQGAIHSPGHWTRDLLRLPPIAAELPEEFEQSFLIGKPWFFCEHEFLPEQCSLSQFRLRCFRGSSPVALVLLFLIATSFSCCLFPSLVWRYVFGRSLSSVFSLFYQIFACPLETKRRID